jgi:hypothetical protein
LIVRGIDQSLVDEVWRELTAYPPGRIESEAAAFIAQQPHVAAFAQSMTGGQDAAVGQAALGLGFLVFKVLERSLGRPFPPVSESRLAAAYQDTRAWLGGAAEPGHVLEHAASPAHPTLVTYILSVFYGGGEHDCDERVRASLYLLLKTLVDVVDLGAVEA